MILGYIKELYRKTFKNYADKHSEIILENYQKLHCKTVVPETFRNYTDKNDTGKHKGIIQAHTQELYRKNFQK